MNDNFAKKLVVKQQGFALLMLVFLLMLAGGTGFLNYLNETNVKIERDKKTVAALAEAKAALIGYSTSGDLEALCTSSCPRPGDLPCPDFDNDGEADPSCGNAAGTTAQDKRLGRLPWKTLGLGDLSDGYGERLWYAVSNSYKSNSRKFPLNSSTLGTITLRNSSGSIVYDGSGNDGLAAVVISVGPPLKNQNRSLQNEKVLSNYLEETLAEKNTDFLDGTKDGFIMGPVFDEQRNLIVNDTFLEIRSTEMANVMAKVVLRRGNKDLLDYYCGVGNSNYNTSKCLSANGGNRKFPAPANFSDKTCFPVDSKLNPLPISIGCYSNDALGEGIFAANPTPSWSSNIIFRGAKSGNWFQQNEWRGLIKYSVVTSCVNGTKSCNVSYLVSDKTLSVQ